MMKLTNIISLPFYEVLRALIYNPAGLLINRFINFKKRPVWTTLFAQHYTYYPTPANLSYNWSYGSLLGLFFVLQILSGVILAMYYVSHTDLAFLFTLALSTIGILGSTLTYNIIVAPKVKKGANSVTITPILLITLPHELSTPEIVFAVAVFTIIFMVYTFLVINYLEKNLVEITQQEKKNSLFHRIAKALSLSTAALLKLRVCFIAAVLLVGAFVSLYCILLTLWYIRCLPKEEEKPLFIVVVITSTIVRYMFLVVEYVEKNLAEITQQEEKNSLFHRIAKDLGLSTTAILKLRACFIAVVLLVTAFVLFLYSVLLVLWYMPSLPTEVGVFLFIVVVTTLMLTRHMYTIIIDCAQADLWVVEKKVRKNSPFQTLKRLGLSPDTLVKAFIESVILIIMLLCYWWIAVWHLNSFTCSKDVLFVLTEFTLYITLYMYIVLNFVQTKLPQIRDWVKKNSVLQQLKKIGLNPDTLLIIVIAFTTVILLLIWCAVLHVGISLLWEGIVLFWNRKNAVSETTAGPNNAETEKPIVKPASKKSSTSPNKGDVKLTPAERLYREAAERNKQMNSARTTVILEELKKAQKKRRAEKLERQRRRAEAQAERGRAETEQERIYRLWGEEVPPRGFPKPPAQQPQGPGVVNPLNYADITEENLKDYTARILLKPWRRPKND